jgi:hypothetical protein
MSQEALRLASERLHHLSMRYVGALAEVVSGKAHGFLPTGWPGLKECRDFIDLILFTRAEINGLTNLLAKAGVVTVEQITKEFAEQYEWFAQEKAKFLGVGISDVGLVFDMKKQPGQG